MYRRAAFDDRIIRLSDMATIPADPVNADYQAYLQWVHDGGSTEEAEVPPPEPISVEAFRVKLLIKRRGLWDALVGALAEAGADSEPVFYFANAPTFRNDHALVQAFAPAIGLNTQGDIDAFFAEARDLTP